MAFCGGFCFILPLPLFRQVQRILNADHSSSYYFLLLFLLLFLFTHFLLADRETRGQG